MGFSISKKWTMTLAALAACGGFASLGFGAAFTPGNLLVTRVGDGAAALASTSTAAFLDEYTPAGALVQSIPMPTIASGGNLALTLTGTSTSEGFLQLSPDGSVVTLAGYNEGTGLSISTSASTLNRSVAIVDGTGAVNTTSGINTGTTGNVRSAISDGSDIWVSTSSLGVQKITAGTVGAGTQLSTAPTNTRVAGIFGGQLYISSASGTFLGVSSIGTGEPTTPGQTTTALPGFPTTGTHSNYDFVFADANTLYVADDGSTANGGGIQKWTQSGGSWSLAYNIQPASSGFRGLTGTSTSGGFLLYATTNAGGLSSILDTGTLAGAVITPLASAPANTAFRGVEFVPTAAAIPEPASLALLGLGAAGLLARRRR